nr:MULTISPECIES: WPE palindromic element domain-containing protein [Wolbachia]
MKQSGQCLLYEHCGLRAISAREDVIPVPRHWDPENLTLNKWLHNKLHIKPKVHYIAILHDIISAFKANFSCVFAS